MNVPLRCQCGTARATLALAPARIASNTVAAPRFATGMRKILCDATAARLSGNYRDDPFFERDSGRPIVAPEVPTPSQRRRRYG